jgi:hypothetical protein
MGQFDEEDIRHAVFAPLRMLSGFVVGGVLGILAFGLAWKPFWPSSFEGLIQAIVLLGTTALIAGGLGALTFAVRPFQRSWQLIMSVGLGTLGGVVAGRVMRSALMIDCLHGTGSQGPWCNAGYSFLPFFLGSALAGGFVAMAISALGVRPSSPN